jgi:hypothetical protein
MYRYLVIRAAKYFRPGELCRTSQAIEYYLKLIISVCALKIKYAIIPQSVADPDPNYFRKLAPDPGLHYSDKLDLDPH